MPHTEPQPNQTQVARPWRKDSINAITPIPNMHEKLVSQNMVGIQIKGREQAQKTAGISAKCLPVNIRPNRKIK